MKMGRCPGPEPAGWVVERHVDPAWHRAHGGAEPLPATDAPEPIMVRRGSMLIGRISLNSAIAPDIDCEPDTGVSRRHAQLSTDGTRWWVEDLRSENGTFLAPAGAPLPSRPLAPGERVPVTPGDRIFLGSWTCLTVCRASSPPRVG